MSDTNVSVFRAIGRFFMFWKWGQAMKINRAADSRFTKDAQGVADAYDIAYAEGTQELKDFSGVVAEYAAAVETKRTQLKHAEEALALVTRYRDGALATIEAAQAANDQEKLTKATTDAKRFQVDLDAKVAAVETLKADIAGQDAEQARLEERAKDLQRKLLSSESDKTTAVADFASAQLMIKANEKLAGLKKPVGQGSPIDAVDKKLTEMKAAARVSSKLAGIDAKADDDKYLAAGATDVASSKIADMLAARAKTKQTATGIATAPVAVAPAAAEEEERRI